MPGLCKQISVLLDLQKTSSESQNADFLPFLRRRSSLSFDHPPSGSVPSGPATSEESLQRLAQRSSGLSRVSAPGNMTAAHGTLAARMAAEAGARAVGALQQSGGSESGDTDSSRMSN